MEGTYKFYVYALIDPDTEEVFYIGRSQDAQQRYDQHVNEAKKYYNAKVPLLVRLFGKDKANKRIDYISGLPKGTSFNEGKLKWICNILSRGKEPDIEVLDEWEVESFEDANKIEEAWIAHYRIRGHPLQNSITSNRMKPEWYNPKKNRHWKDWYAKSPMEYIERVKSKTKIVTE